MQDLMELDYRKKIIEEIKGDENVQRKIVSFKKQNMQSDNFNQYVVEHLETKLDHETVKELHVFSDVNLQKRISTSEAGVYRYAPERTFYNGEKIVDGMGEVYEEMNINTKLRQANVAYKYQEQCAVQIYHDEQCLKTRVLLPHHYDVIPDEQNPEKAFAYVISNFDNSDRDKVRRSNERTAFSQGDKYRDSINQEIADVDDSKLKTERFFVWTRKHNFVMNGKGEILDKKTNQPLPVEIDENDANVLSPIAEYEILPFIDIASTKDFEFWVRTGDVLYYATIMYNVILTSEFQTVEMQGHAQPYYKGNAEHMPENMRIGVDKMIFIPIDPQNPVQSEFGFANPGSDLSGIREFRESFLSSFLSSRGIDTGIISGKGSVDKASSGIEKLLQMIEKFEASQDDFAMFKNVEGELAQVTSAFINSLKGERVDGEPSLKEIYNVDLPEPNKVKVNTEFQKPEMIKTEMEVLEVAEKEFDMGVSSKVHYLMEHKGMTEPQAIDHIKTVDKYSGLTEPTTTDGDDNNGDSNDFKA